MKENVLPPTWCSAICRNAMNEICVENCALKRDCSAFEEKPGLELPDMPRFPKQDELTTPAEKFTAVSVYLSKTIDHLQGYKHEPQPVIKRPSLNRSTGSGVLADEQVESILSLLHKETTVYQASEERKDQNE